MMDREFTSREAAFYLMGYLCAKRRVPQRLKKHAKTAVEIINGGAFNPLCVYELQDECKRIHGEALEKEEERMAKHDQPNY